MCVSARWRHAVSVAVVSDSSSRTIGMTFAPYSSTARSRALTGMRAGGVDQVEPADVQRLDRAGDLARDGLGRADVQRAVGDLGVELLALDRRPAAQRADPVADHLVARPEQLPRLLVGVGDEARGVHPDRVGHRAELMRRRGGRDRRTARSAPAGRR